jgi:hypothetical protein
MFRAAPFPSFPKNVISAVLTPDMSDRQRLVTRLTAGLTRPLMARYKYFLSQNESDSAAKHMLREDIETLKQDVSNPHLEIVMRDPIHSMHRKGWRQKDYSAMGHYDHLNIPEALAGFLAEKGPDNAHQRAICYLLQGKFYDALRVATKSSDLGIILVSSVGCGEFEIAAGQVPNVYQILAEADLVVSHWECFHMVLFASLACQNAQGIEETFAVLEQSRANIGLDKLLDWGKKFVDREFKEFVFEIGTWRNWCRDSFYLRGVAEQLFKAIRMNVVLNMVMPYAVMPLSQVTNETGIGMDEVTQAVRTLIRQGKLEGVLDLIGDKYVSRPDVEAVSDFEQVLYRSAAVKEKIQELKWDMEAA